MKFCFPKLWVECSLFSLFYRIEFVTYIKVLKYFRHLFKAVLQNFTCLLWVFKSYHSETATVTRVSSRNIP